MRSSNGVGGPDGDIRDLFSYNLQRLAGLSSRIAQIAIKPEFGLGSHDWRALAVLDYLGAAPLQVLAQRAGVQKSQMSRTVTALEDQGYILRQDNPRDRRSPSLALTEKGRNVTQKILAASQQRNEEMLANLSEEERFQLMALIEKVAIGSFDLLNSLKGKEESPESVPEPASIFDTERM